MAHTLSGRAYLYSFPRYQQGREVRAEGFCSIIRRPEQVLATIAVVYGHDVGVTGLATTTL